MLPSTSAGEETQFEEGSERVSRSGVDLNQFHEHDKNKLFYGLLLGLLEASLLKQGSKSVQGLRRELMQCLMKIPLDQKLGSKTVEEHIKSRMDSRAQEDDTSVCNSKSVRSSRRSQDLNERQEISIKEKVKLYSQLMMNVDGDKNVDKDDCFEGGELEVYLNPMSLGDGNQNTQDVLTIGILLNIYVCHGIAIFQVWIAQTLEAEIPLFIVFEIERLNHTCPFLFTSSAWPPIVALQISLACRVA